MPSIKQTTGDFCYKLCNGDVDVFESLQEKLLTPIKKVQHRKNTMLYF